jgi:predicted acylesterase/phospholipase RssA
MLQNLLSSEVAKNVRAVAELRCRDNATRFFAGYPRRIDGAERGTAVKRWFEPMNYQIKSITQKTAFVFAGGGSFGATQVGMMQALAEHGVVADMVVGSSVCAMNGAYYAGTPTLEEVEQLAGIWPGFRRQDVFPIAFSMLVGFLWRWDFLVSHSGLPKLIDEHLPFENLEDATMPVHIVTTDIVSGNAVVLYEGSAREAITATTSTASRFGHRKIPVAFSRCRRTGGGVEVFHLAGNQLARRLGYFKRS